MNNLTIQNEPITLKELSQHLNLSISTVSRALNGRGKFRSSTVTRIKSEAARLNYFPNANATSLRSRACKRVGIIFSPSVPTCVLAQLDHMMNSHQFIMSIALISPDEDWFKAYDRLKKNGVDGIIAINYSIDQVDDKLLCIDTNNLLSLRKKLLDFFLKLQNVD